MKKRFLVPLTFLLFLTSCGNAEKKEVSFNEGFEVLQKAISSTEIPDRIGASFVAEKLNVESLEKRTENNQTVTISNKLGISNMDLNFAIEGLTSATDFNGLKASLTLGGSLKYQVTNSADSSKNQDLTFSELFVGAYVDNSNFYADISNSALKTLLTKISPEIVTYSKIYLPINTTNSGITFPIISKDAISQITNNDGYNNFIEQIKNMDVTIFNDIVKMYSLGDNRFELSISANAENVTKAYVDYIMSNAEGTGDSVVTSEMYELYLAQMKDYVSEFIDHINLSLVFNEKGFSSLDVDMKVMLKTHETGANYDYINTMTYDFDYALSLVEGNDVNMNLPSSYEDYALLDSSNSDVSAIA